MKNLTTVAFVIFQLTIISPASVAQEKTVTLMLRSFVSKNDHVQHDSAIEAIKIVNIVLNSQEFKDSVNLYNFKCENYGESCHGERIRGRTVLDSIYKNPVFDLDLIMKNCRREYGHSEENEHYIKSCYKKLRKDDKKLPFSYIYAYHICHEYMHIVGFYHTDHIDDVAERVGWIAYHILDKWYAEKRKF